MLFDSRCSWPRVSPSSSNPSSIRLVILLWGVFFLGTIPCTNSRLGVFELENQSLTPPINVPTTSTAFSPKLFLIKAYGQPPATMRTYLIVVVVITSLSRAASGSVLHGGPSVRSTMRPGTTYCRSRSASNRSARTPDGPEMVARGRRICSAVDA